MNVAEDTDVSPARDRVLIEDDAHKAFFRVVTDHTTCAADVRVLLVHAVPEDDYLSLDGQKFSDGAHSGSPRTQRLVKYMAAPQTIPVIAAFSRTHLSSVFQFTSAFPLP